MKHEVSAVARRVDLNLLVVLDAVYRARSLTEAGQRLGLSQPAVSHALSRLRTTVKDPLFVRTPRGVVPTPLADEIAPLLAEGLGMIRASFEPRRFDPATSTRLFTIVMADIGETVQLPILLRAVRDAPGIRLRTVALPPPQARAALAEGTVDLSLSNFPVRMPLHEESLGRPGYATIVRVGHPLIRGKLTVPAFKKARHLLVRPTGTGVWHGERVEKALQRLGIADRIAVQIGHFQPAGVIVAQSDLIATIPWGLAKTLASTMPLRMFAPPMELGKQHLSLIWHERYHRDPGNQWLREIIIREMRQLYEKFQ